MNAGWEAIVAGGGPAGSVCAALLARCGRRVLLLERERFPRDHVGESLSPAASRIFEAVGAGDALGRAGFMIKSGATFAWGPQAPEWTISYGDAAPPALQARRAELDHILLEHAARSGVDVRQGCRVTAALRDGDRIVGVRLAEADGSERDEWAPWVIDATGRGSHLARRLGPRQPCRDLQHSAVWSYWEDAGRLPGRDAGNTVWARNELGALWYVPLDDRTNRVIVGVVVGADGCHELVYGIERFYDDAIAAAPAISRLLAGARRVTPVHAAAAGAFCATRLAGPGWLLAGDAACFVDPILTPGVQIACQQGQVAASVVDAVLAQPDLEDQALALYDRLHRQQYETFVWLCRNLYGPAPHAAQPDGGGQLAFLSLISGMPRPQLLRGLSQYTAMRQRAAARRGQRPVFGAEEGFAFLTVELRSDRRREAMSARVRGELTDDAAVSLAPGARLGNQLFLPDRGTGRLRPGRAATNRFGDRFQATPELEALFASLQDGPACAELERRFGRALGTEVGGRRPAFRRWLELLAEHALIEWGDRPPHSVCTGEPCAE